MSGHHEVVALNEKRLRFRRRGKCAFSFNFYGFDIGWRNSRGSGKNTLSSAVDTVSMCNSKRIAKASMISSTRISGAEAPAVIPSEEILLNKSHSTSSARKTRRASLHPARSATSFNLCEFDELEEPTTSKASTAGATRFTASCRLVVA